MSRFCLLLLFFPAVGSQPVFSGVYIGADTFEPFLITHAAGYNGTENDLTVTVCAEPNAATAVPLIQNALDIWNSLTPMTSNCPGCLREEDPAQNPDEPLSMGATILHELGHCALGLGHINWNNNGATSFTNSQDAVSIAVGADMVEGTADDLPSPLPGTRLIHWFRIADNNPTVIDSTAIDDQTYSRRILDLPSGDSWPASGNKKANEELGFVDTQAVMYTNLTPGSEILGLTADAVNTVSFARTGLDTSLNTADDYQVTFEFSYDCTIAQVEVRFIEMIPDDNGGNALGRCLGALEVIDTGGLFDIHHMLSPPDGEARLIIEVLSPQAENWDVVFANGFETGDITGWSEAVP